MSFNRFFILSLEETIKMTNRLDIKNLALKSMHMPLESTPEEIQSIASSVREAGIDLYGAGVIYMKNPEEVDVVSFEHEKDGKDPFPGLAESVSYVRGVLKTIA